MPKISDERFNRLETLIERGLAALAGDIADSNTEIIGLRDAVAGLREETQTSFADIRAELKDIRVRLDALESGLQNISGFANEIGRLIERVSAIERHLGLQQSIAA